MTRALDPVSAEKLIADSRWLHSLARGLAGESGADDLVSETWLAAARRPPRFWENLRPWLRTVARNLSLRERDREARRREREARAARREAQPSTADLVARATLRRSVVDAVLDLPEPYRSTILLRFFEELPPRDVARRLDVPVATVRTRIGRGLEQLRARLDREQGARHAWIAMLAPAKSLLGTLGVTGAIVMGAKAKVAGVAVVLLLGALGWWQWSHWSGPAPASPAEEPAVESSPAAVTSPEPVAAASPAPRAILPRPYAEDSETEFAITGVVVDDRNDRPVEGIAASVMAWVPKPESAATDATTDRDGKFRVPVRQKTRVRGLAFLSPDYAPLVLDHLENDVRSAQGEALDLGTLRLLRGARVSGRVVSDNREPIPGAKLFVSPRGYPVTLPLLAEARPVGASEADGTFTLPERVAPNLEQEAILSAVTPEGIGWTFLAIVKDREDLTGVEIVVSRGAAARVTVVDEAEKPVEGALVFAIPRFAPLGPPRYFGAGYANGFDRDELGGHFAKRTGADGVVAFRGLPVGRTDERFTQYPGSGNAYDFRAYHEDYVVSVPASIDVDAAAEVSTTIKLVRKTLCTIRGRITNESGSPIEGARVESRGEGVLATADRDGAYRIAGRDTAHGQFYFEIRADGYAMLWRKVEVSAKADDIVADFVLLKATPIKGRVIGQDGKPVPGAYVDLLDGRTDENRRQLRPDGNGALDDEGRFVFSDATAGPWKMRVYGPDPHEDWIPPRDRIVQGGDQNVEVVLRRHPAGRARLEAEIVDAATGAAMDAAESHLRMVSAATFSGDHIASARTQASVGRVTAEKLRPGKWALFVRLADGSRVTRDFTVKPDDTLVKLRIEVGKPASVTVKIDLSAIPDGARPTSVHVWTNPGDAVQWMSKPGVVAPRCSRGVGTADASNGWAVLFGDVTPNVPIEIWTTSDGGKDCRAEAVVTAGFGEEKELVLKPVLNASVTFRKPDDAPSGVVIVSIRRPDGTWAQINWSDIWEDRKEWKFERDVLPGHIAWRAERFSIDAEPTDRVPLAVVEGEFDLAAGDSREVKIVFSR